MVDTNNTISQRIRSIRQKHGLTQTQFAESLGVTQNTVTFWERRGYEPRIDMVKEICKMYHVSADWLIGLKEGEDDG